MGWPIIVCGKGSIWKVIASVKRFTDVEKYQRGNSVWVSLPRFLTKGEFCCSICNENFPKVLPVHLGRGGDGFASKCRIRSTKTGGQLSLLDWGGGCAFISVDVKGVAMVQCQLFPTKFRGIQGFAKVCQSI